MITAIDKRTALVLIDLQKGIVNSEKAHPLNTILNNAAKLVSAFRNAGLPVVVVNVNPMGAKWTKARADSPSVPQNPVVQSLAKAALPLTGFTDIVPEIITEANDIFITKKNWNAFYDTNLHAALEQRTITQIVLAGISTSIGVEGTARAASELGYNIAFATDAMTDKEMSCHNHSLQYIFPRIGELGTTIEIIEHL
jgi:nicotinamidase-related amidase